MYTTLIESSQDQDQEMALQILEDAVYDECLHNGEDAYNVISEYAQMLESGKVSLSFEQDLSEIFNDSLTAYTEMYAPYCSDVFLEAVQDTFLGPESIKYLPIENNANNKNSLLQRSKDVLKNLRNKVSGGSKAVAGVIRRGLSKAKDYSKTALNVAKAGAVGAGKVIGGTGKAIGRAGMYTGKAIGRAGMNTGKAIGRAGMYTGKAIGRAGMNTGKAIGRAGMNTGKATVYTAMHPINARRKHLVNKYTNKRINLRKKANRYAKKASKYSKLLH